jgi:hypothetical protein
MRSRLFLCLLVCAVAAALLILPGAAVRAQAPPAVSENAVKAAFLVKFGSFVEWPPGTFARADQPLVIGISGDDTIAAELDRLATGRSVDGHPLAVKRLAEGAPTAGVHILYLAARRESRLQDALEAAAGPVLTVTSQPGALALGSVLNFITEEGRVRFAASLTSAEARNLKLSARLLAVAQAVEGRAR